MTLTLEDLLALLEVGAIQRVTTDSRQLKAGDLFVALVGDNFDGHAFIPQAEAKGAVALLVSKPVISELPQVLVPDTLIGLQQLAALWRGRYEGIVVGITGSNGKTTTKQLCASVLLKAGTNLFTEGNLNNHIGVPLTLLRLNANYYSAVIEMGANHAGEIALLADLAKPRIGIITQAGDAHLEGFGSRDGVARAKGELYQALEEDGIAILNRDDAYYDYWLGINQAGAVVSFGFHVEANVRAINHSLHSTGSEFTLITPEGRAEVSLPLPGEHNIRNALAAAAVGVVVGLNPSEIARGLMEVQAPKGRVVVKTAPLGGTVIDDTYNANPTSLKAAIDLLAQEKGQRWLVLGNMAELGADTEQLHAECGRYAKQQGLDALYTCGQLATFAAAGFGEGARHFDDLDSLIAALRPRLIDGVTVLVKGSRSAGMERVVQPLLAVAPPVGEVRL
jgi:UDP-N-acetylmuramoyl-tripeptide--D-alanyl-D-alanine ligase